MRNIVARVYCRTCQCMIFVTIFESTIIHTHARNAVRDEKRASKAAL